MSVCDACVTLLLNTFIFSGGGGNFFGLWDCGAAHSLGSWDIFN